MKWTDEDFQALEAELLESCRTAKDMGLRIVRGAYFRYSPSGESVTAICPLTALALMYGMAYTAEDRYEPLDGEVASRQTLRKWAKERANARISTEQMSYLLGALLAGIDDHSYVKTKSDGSPVSLMVDKAYEVGERVRKSLRLRDVESY